MLSAKKTSDTFSCRVVNHQNLNSSLIFSKPSFIFFLCHFRRFFLLAKWETIWLGKNEWILLRRSKELLQKMQIKFGELRSFIEGKFDHAFLLINSISMIMTKILRVDRFIFFVSSYFIELNLLKSTHFFWNDSWRHSQTSRLSQSSLIIWWIFDVVV